MASSNSPLNSNDITREDILSLARLVGLSIHDSELDEVTFRLAALQRELRKLESLDLSQVEPLPLFPVEEGA